MHRLGADPTMNSYWTYQRHSLLLELPIFVHSCRGYQTMYIDSEANLLFKIFLEY